MSSKKSLKLFASIFMVIIVSLVVARPASAFLSQNSGSWLWGTDTRAVAVAIGDVNGDGQNEIVTGGYFNDGAHWNTQLMVLNAATLALENYAFWRWGSDTEISSIAIGDVNGDLKNEIVTGGALFDGTRWNTQVMVLSASTTSTAMSVLNTAYWYWNSDTQISSVAIGDVNGDLKNEIVTGGSFFDGTRFNAQLMVLSASATSTAVTVLNYAFWYWNSDTQISSVAIGDVNGDLKNEIVTGGSFFDGTRSNSQLMMLSASTTSTAMTVLNYAYWYWTSDTYINSVALGNITRSTGLSVVTGGSYFDGTRNNAQLLVLSPSTTTPTFNVLNVAFWYWTGNTQINSVAVGNFSGASTLDIFTAGTFNDGRNHALLHDLDSSTMATRAQASWLTVSDTEANSVATGNFAGFGNRVVVVGSFWDNVHSNAQITIWG